MRKGNAFPSQKGIINFLPLVVIAVLLIGFVGYFSVNRLRNNLKENVLGDSNSQLASTETDLESQIDVDSKGLDDVGDINESVEAGVEFKSDPTPTVSGSYQDGMGTPSALYVNTNVSVKNHKFLGLISVKLSDNSFFLRYLGFLFTK